MLPENKLQFSEYSGLYDRVVPADNLLRQINDLIDFSFVRKELVEKYCKDNGRTAQDPVRMFKYLLLKTIYDMSDGSVVERSRYDMSFKYFLDMTPEEDVINPSSLCKFRKLRLKDTDLLSLLIGKTVSIAVEKGIIKSNSIIVDATHTASRSNPMSAVDMLRLRAKQLRKTVYGHDEELKDIMPKKNDENDIDKELAYTEKLLKTLKENPVLCEIPKIKERIEILQEVMSDVRDNLDVSLDEDAKIGHKSEDSAFFGYKSHLAMTEERIIVGAVVTSGEKGDGPVLPELVEQAENNGIEVKTIIGDAAYSGKGNIELASDKGIELVSRFNPSISVGIRKDEDKFDYNKDAGMFVCPAGHMAIRKARQGKKGVNRNQADVYFFDVEKCRRCPLREGCYRPGAKSKTYSISVKTPEQNAHLKFEKSERFREKMKERYKIEAKNAELKNVYGYGRAESYGIDCMRLQGAMAIFASNLKRIIKIYK